MLYVSKFPFSVFLRYGTSMGRIGRNGVHHPSPNFLDHLGEFSHMVEPT